MCTSYIACNGERQLSTVSAGQAIARTMNSQLAVDLTLPDPLVHSYLLQKALVEPLFSRFSGASAQATKSAKNT